MAVTVTSEGLNYVRRPTLDDLHGLPVMGGLDSLTPPGASSNGSSHTTHSTDNTPGSATASTPNSTLASGDSNATAVSPSGILHPYGVEYDQNGKELPPAVAASRPVISVQTFTPLIGSLLMSQSPDVCNSAKTAIVSLLARLRGKTVPQLEPWSERHVQPGELKAYSAQGGTHLHRIHGLAEEDRKIVENELLQAIVIGMARLDEGHGEMDESRGSMYQEGEMVDYAARAGEGPVEAEATDSNVNESHDLPAVSQDGMPGDVPNLTDPTGPEFSVLNEPSNPFDTISSRATDLADDDPLSTVTVQEVTSSSPERYQDGGEDDWTRYGMDYGGDAEGEAQYRSELAQEASQGRHLSMLLISAVVESRVLDGDDIVETQFVPEVVRMKEDLSPAVRKQAALAMGALAKIVSGAIANQHLVSLKGSIVSIANVADDDLNTQVALFETFSYDEDPTVREAACLALPAICRHLTPRETQRENAVAYMNAFLEDSVRDVRFVALDVLGEVIYVFAEDKEGPPAQLLEHFLARKASSSPEQAPQLNIYGAGTMFMTMMQTPTDPKPLTCAFNVCIPLFSSHHQFY